MVFCHRRHAVVNLFVLFYLKKGQVKSPILHNTRDGSEFCVPKILVSETWALGRVGGGRGIPGSTPCMKHRLLKCKLVVEINLGGGIVLRVVFQVLPLPFMKPA